MCSARANPAAATDLRRGTDPGYDFLRHGSCDGDQLRQLTFVDGKRVRDDRPLEAVVFKAAGKQRPFDVAQILAGGVLETLGDDEVSIVQLAYDGART